MGDNAGAFIPGKTYGIIHCHTHYSRRIARLLFIWKKKTESLVRVFITAVFLVIHGLSEKS